MARPPSAIESLFQRFLGWLWIPAVGVLLGQQYVYPNKRVIPVVLAVIVVGIVWRLDLVTGIAFLVLAVPYPRSTIFGTTNLAFVLLLATLWLVRVSTRQLPPPRTSPIDLPIVGLVILYILSFNNVRGTQPMSMAFANFELFIGSVIMYFLITNNIRTERDLRRLHDAQLVSALTVFLLGIWEVNHPGQTFIRGWIGFQHSEGTEFLTRNVRIGSAFFDYELLSEFAAVTLLLAVFRWLRAATNNERNLYLAFMVLNVFILFATVTRGALLSLALALPLLLWHTRRRIRFVPLVVGTSLLVALFIGMNFFVSHYTRSGDLFSRLAETHVVKGWIPDSRGYAWPNAWARALVHPWIGQGPYYGDMAGFGSMWPHNVYLYYANIVGFVGLGFYLLMLVRFFQITQPRADDVAAAPYAEAFLPFAQAQLVLFVVNEVKIDYLRNPIYQTVVWVMFSAWTAAYSVARSDDRRARAPGP